jgi:mono/diheme cytochrome c family protein
MGVIVIVTLFVLLAVGVFLLAMNSGAGQRRREARGKPARGGIGGVALVVGALVLVIGIAAPVLVMIANANSSPDAVGGVQLTAGEEEGRELFRENCATCHALADVSAVGRVGPDLDQMRPPADLTANAIEQGRARGMGQMPSQLLTGEDVRKVSEYVARVAGR